MNIWRIKDRILLSALLPGLLIAVLLYLYLISTQQDFYDELTTARGITITEQFASAIEYGVLTGNRGLLEDLTKALLHNRHISGIAITDAEEHILLSVGSLASRYALPHEFAESSALCLYGADSLIFCAPIYPTELETEDFRDENQTPSQRVIGYVSIELSTAPVTERRRQAAMRALSITLLVLFISALVATRIARHIAQPIESLTQTVHEVGKGHLDKRVSSESNSEIGQLQRGVDAMIASLKLNQEQLQGRVHDATAKLQSALKELEQKNHDLERQRRHAEEASLSKSRFLANMTHEIRTPLNGILGMLSLLQDTRVDPQQKNYLHHLGLATKSLRALIEDILDFSRIEAGKLTLDKREFNPLELIDEVVMMLSPQAHEKGLELILDITPGFPTRLTGDPLRLRQVLINLIANAIKFTLHGEVLVACHYQAEPAPAHGRLHVEVCDTGIGIPQDKLATIFDSFTQVDDKHTRAQSGTGLGTAIARELIRLMGGRIGVQSEEGVGSRFWFELPCQEPGSTLAPVTSQHLLLLEQNRHHARAIAHAAASLGVTLSKAADTEEAVRLIQQGLDTDTPIAAVLLAEQGTTPHHLDTARQLRQRFAARCPQLVHLGVAGLATDPQAFDQLLTKPLTLHGLARLIASLEAASGSGQNATPAQGKQPPAGLRILVAEDNSINALVISSFLEKLGHTVRVVRNGLEALAAMEAEGFDVVFMDMRMPEMDGLQATRRWRERENSGHHLPIIALTANATTQDRKACLESGMDDFLAKPIEQEQLAQLLAGYRPQASA